MRAPLRNRIPALLPFPGVFAAYCVAAWLGMAFVLPEAGVSLVWPAAGVALAALWRFGLWQAPTVLAAAFTVQLALGHALLPSLMVAGGAALAAVVAVTALRRCGFDAAMEKMGDVLCFVLFGALLSSAVSSLTGAGARYAAGLVQWQGFDSLWWLCWVTDLSGILLVAPPLLTAARPGRRWLEPVAMAALVAATAWLVYSDVLPPGIAMAKPLSYLVFPVMICAAVRNTQHTVALLLLLHAAVAVVYTAAGHGPFGESAVRENLPSLYAHLAMVSLTTLLLTAALSERRSAEAARRRAEEASRQHLHALARVGRVSAMGETAAGLAHELNQPLCAITTYAQACLRLLEPGAEPHLRRAIERVAANAQRSGEIIRQMRAQVRKGPQDTAPADLNALIREALELAAADIRDSGVTVETRLTAGLPPVDVAAVQIHQVMINLVNNALEAMAAQRPGAPRRLTVRSRDVADGVEVSVADTGPGLAPQRCDDLFEPFVTDRPGGHGLGLSISRTIVETHGGRMSAANLETGGAELRFTLPASPGRMMPKAG